MRYVTLVCLLVCAACGDAPFTASEVRHAPTGDDAAPSHEASAGDDASDPSEASVGDDAASDGGSHPVTDGNVGVEASSEAGSEGGLSQCCMVCIQQYALCEHTCVNTNDDASDNCNLCGPGYLTCAGGCGNTCPPLSSI